MVNMPGLYTRLVNIGHLRLPAAAQVLVVLALGFALSCVFLVTVLRTCICGVESICGFYGYGKDGVGTGAVLVHHGCTHHAVLLANLQQGATSLVRHLQLLMVVMWDGKKQDMLP
jgi:hypothetical protein